MKTYSVCILSANPKKLGNGLPYWITNWNQYSNLDEIDWPMIQQLFFENPDWLAYGYMHGHNSRNLTSAKNRVVKNTCVDLSTLKVQ